MKKIFSLISTTFVMLSCLELQPQDFTSPSTWYSNQKELESALAGVYDPLRDLYCDYLSVQLALATDEAFSKESAPKKVPYYYVFDKGDRTVQSTWEELYRGIDNANNLLENADRADCDEDIIKQIKGEALFLRGYYHFLLVGYWGDVPLKLSSTKNSKDVHTPRSPQADVYTSIINDMTTSLDMVADISTLGFGGRVSKSAVKGMLARVCLNAAGRIPDADTLYYCTKAREWAKSLMDDKFHELNLKYEDVFINLMQDKYEIKENIFEVECYGTLNTAESKEVAVFPSYYTAAWGGDWTVNDNGETLARGRGYFYCTPQLYDMYEDGDRRRDWTISPYIYVEQKQASGADGFTKRNYPDVFRFRWPGKFRREYQTVPSEYAYGNSTNYPLLRYSDVLLMFAEADNYINHGPSSEALEAANQVRRRAFGLKPEVPADDVDLTAMTEEEFLKYLQKERARELALEGHRKFDLLRWGIFYETMKNVAKDFRAIPLKVENNKGEMVDNPIYRWNGSGFPGIDVCVRSYDNFAEQHLLMPIPEREFTVNKAITQNNPGWE